MVHILFMHMRTTINWWRHPPCLAYAITSANDSTHCLAYLLWGVPDGTCCGVPLVSCGFLRFNAVVCWQYYENDCPLCIRGSTYVYGTKCCSLNKYSGRLYNEIILGLCMYLAYVCTGVCTCVYACLFVCLSASLFVCFVCSFIHSIKCEIGARCL